MVGWTEISVIFWVNTPQLGEAFNFVGSDFSHLEPSASPKIYRRRVVFSH
jgi:hypothetical protein